MDILIDEYKILVRVPNSATIYQKEQVLTKNNAQALSPNCFLIVGKNKTSAPMMFNMLEVNCTKADLQNTIEQYTDQMIAEGSTLEINNEFYSDGDYYLVLQVYRLGKNRILSDLLLCDGKIYQVTGKIGEGDEDIVFATEMIKSITPANK